MWLNRRSKTNRSHSVDHPEVHDHDAPRDADHDLMRALSQIPPAKIEKVDESFMLLDSGLGAIFSAAMARRAAVERNKRKDVITHSDSSPNISVNPKRSKVANPGRIRTALLLRKAAEKFRAPVRRHEAQEATMNLLNNIVETRHISSEYKLDTRGMNPNKKFDSNASKTDPESSSSEEIDPSAEIEHDESVRKWALDNLKLSPDRLIGLEENKGFRSKLRHQMLCWEALRADKLLPPGMSPLVPGAVEFIEEIANPIAKAGEPSVQGMVNSMTKDASTSSLTTRATPTSLTGQSVATEDGVAYTSNKANSVITEDVSAKFHDAAQSFFGLTQHMSSMRMRRARVPPAAFYQDDKPESPRSEADALFGDIPRVPEWPGRERLPVLALEDAIEPVSARPTLSERTKLRAALPPLNKDQATGPYSARAKVYGSMLESGKSSPTALSKKQLIAAAARASSNQSSPNADVDVLSEGVSKWNLRLGSHGQAPDAAWPSFSLRRPPPFVEPHREVMSTDVGKTPELAYYRRCEAHGLIPCPAVWGRFGKGIVDAGRRTLGDADVYAIVETAVERAAAGYALLALDLGYNLMTDAGIEKVMRLLSEPWTKLPPAVSSPQPALTPEVPGSALVTLSFAGNSSIRFSSDRVLENLCKSFSVLKRLSSLDLSGIHARTGSMVRLCSAMEKALSLKALRLVDCGLGSNAGQQEDCIAVAGLLGQRPGGWKGLLSADLAWNFFNRSGFAAAASALRHSRLVSLSFAGNGSMVAGVANPNWQGGSKDVHFHPMQLLIEGLIFNNTLQTLDFSNCCIGPDSAFVLEDALHHNMSLASMDMSENPLGDEGLRYLIRLLTITGTHIRVVGMREADATCHRVKYRYSQPGRIYRLNLRYPHERAILRTLLRIGAGKARGTAALRHFRFDTRQAKPCVEKEPETDRWIVPTTGVYNFTFQPPMSQTAQKSIMARTSETQMAETVAAAAAAATAGSGQLKRSRNSERRGTTSGRRNSNNPFAQGTTKGGFHTGLGGDHHRISLLVEKPGYVDAAALAENKAAMVKGRRQKNRQKASATDATMRITDPAKRAARAASIDWLEVEGLLSESRIRISALRFPLVRSMFLSLETQEQQQRFIHACSRDMSFNFTQVMQLCKDRPETADKIACALFPCVVGRTSQLLLLGAVKEAARISKEVAQCLWFQEGNLTGRYHLDLLKPADYAVAESCLLVNAWESEVGRILLCPDVSQRGNYEMLRNESWNEEPFTYSRDWCLPSHGFLKFDYSSIRRPPPKLAAMSEAGEVTRYLQKITATAAIKLRALRAISVHIYLSTCQFRNLIQCFPMGAYRRDFFCMFHTRVVDLSRFLGPELLYNHSVFSPKDCASLLKRVGFLHLLNPLVPEGPRFTCNLAVYEERMVLDFFVQLSKEEPGGRVLGASPGDPEGPVHSVPASWADKGVPCDQENITCCYDTTNPNMSWRLVLAERYCVGMFMTPHLHHDHHYDEEKESGRPSIHTPVHPLGSTPVQSPAHALASRRPLPTPLET